MAFASTISGLFTGRQRPSVRFLPSRPPHRTKILARATNSVYPAYRPPYAWIPQLRRPTERPVKAPLRQSFTYRDLLFGTTGRRVAAEPFEPAGAFSGRIRYTSASAFFNTTREVAARHDDRQTDQVGCAAARTSETSSVPNPRTVRYAWQANPAAMWFKRSDLPASPFRTHDWPRMNEGRTIH